MLFKSTFLSDACYRGEHSRCNGIVPQRLPSFAFLQDFSPKARCECSHHKESV
jgi:hypothetical protein